MRLRDLARDATRTESPLPPAYFALFRTWFLCGIPAFAAVVAIIWIMLVKPTISLG
jgi:uncharacterized membrane protein